MNFEYEGCKFRITFQYAVIEGANGIRCYIDDVSDEQHKRVANGYSRCVSGDRFVKETGRKIALTRALDKMFIELSSGQYPLTWLDVFPTEWSRRGFRAAAWKSYFERKAPLMIGVIP
jgi:hypothetical protein